MHTLTRKQRLIVTTLIALAAPWLMGQSCSPTTPSTPAPPITLPEADQKILDDLGQTYLTLRQSQTADAVRTSMVTALNNGYAGVAKATLGSDSSTIFIQFSDGYLGGLSTDEDFGNLQGYNSMAIHASIRTRSVTNARRMEPAGLQLQPASFSSRACFACKSSSMNKVLLLSAAQEDLGNAVGGSQGLFPNLKDTFVEISNWSDSDVVIKWNQQVDGYSALRFNDFFALGDYGAIVMIAHAIRGETRDDESNPASAISAHDYIQVAASLGYAAAHTTTADYESERIDVEKETRSGRIINVNKVNAAQGTARTYLYMRNDLWSEKMDTLPQSFVYVGTPQADRAAQMLTSLGAISAAAWDHTVSTAFMLDAAYILDAMAYGNINDIVAWYEGWITTKTPALYLDEVVAQLQLRHGTTISHAYLPTWLNVITRDCPANTSTTEVSLVYADQHLDNPIPVRNNCDTAKTVSGLLPLADTEVVAKALDANGNTLITINRQINLMTGGNALSLRFVNYGIAAASSPASVPADGYNTAQVTVTLRKYSNDLENLPSGNPLAGKRVVFSTDLGELVGATDTVTGAGGQASVQIRSTKAGKATITVRTPDENRVAGCTVTFTQPQADPNAKTKAFLSGSSKWNDTDPFFYVTAGVYINTYINDQQASATYGPFEYDQAYHSEDSTFHATLPINLDSFIGDKLTVSISSLNAGAIGPLYVHYLKSGVPKTKQLCGQTTVQVVPTVLTTTLD